MRSMAIIACKLQKNLSTRTPAQIKKHAECFFKQNFKTNSAGIESPSLPMGKLKSWSKMVLNNKNIDNLSHLRTKFKCYAKMLMHTGHNVSPFLVRTKIEF